MRPGETGPGPIRTGRLTCIPPARGDLGFYRQLFSDPEVNRWLRPDPLDDFGPAEVERLLRHDRDHWRRYGFGPWIVCERASGLPVGRGGFVWTVVAGERRVELPWALLAEFHGRGYATEQARAAVGAARAFGLDELVSLTLPGNAASRRVMEKAGLVPAGEVEHFGLRHVLYRIVLDEPGRGRQSAFGSGQ